MNGKPFFRNKRWGAGRRHCGAGAGNGTGAGRASQGWGAAPRRLGRFAFYADASGAVDVAVLPVGLARGPRLGAQPLFWAQGADLADGRAVLAARDRGGLGLG